MPPPTRGTTVGKILIVGPVDMFPQISLTNMKNIIIMASRVREELSFNNITPLNTSYFSKNI